MERERPRVNRLAGAVGALLGALIGGACIVVGSRLGYVSIVSGVVMVFCTTKGWALLGGRLDKLGALICGVLMTVMTYHANSVSFALEVMAAVEDVSFFTALRELDAFQEAKVIDGYWGQLFFLYLLVLVSSLPLVIGASRKPAAAPRDPGQAPHEEQPDIQGTFYVMRKDWMAPLRLSVTVPVLAAFVVAIILWLVVSKVLPGVDTFPIMAGGFLSTTLLFCMALPTIMLCNAFHIVYVREGTRLWRVDLGRLYGAQDQGVLTQSRWEVMKQDILWEIQAIHRGERSQVLRPGALVELKDLQVERETRWSWVVSYETETGSRKKLSIGKGYPDFTPGRNLERPQGPVPCRWSFVLLALVVTTALLAPGCAAMLGPQPESPGPTMEPEPTVEPVHIPARVPESITEYEMSGVWFRADSTFQAGRRTFLDGETGTFYRFYVQYGVDAEDAWDTLTQSLSEYRATAQFDHFKTIYQGEDLLTPLGKDTRYNILSVYLNDGQVAHTAAVLSDTGALFTMEAKHDPTRQSAEDVLANLMYTLESVRFGELEVTEENYQSQIHVAEVRDCEFIATAYIKTDIFGHDAFVDVYVPYSDRPIYSGDGRAIRSEAHGLRSYVTILPGENAKAVIDAQQQALAASGRVYEEGVDDELYREDLDAACKLTVYEENGQKRYAILYADPKWEGYYLFREFTGLPELVDGDYLAALAELEKVSGLTMPALEALGQAEK